MIENRRRPGSWRDYQKSHRKGLRQRILLRRLPWLGLWAFGLALVVGVLGYSVTWISAHLEQTPIPRGGKPKEEPKGPEPLTRTDLVGLLKQIDWFTPPFHEDYGVERNGARLSVETSLDPSLQSYVHELLQRSATVEAALVVLEPSTGRILSMAEYQNGGTQGGNLCFKAEYPAASLFKIVAAAAAMEARGLTPESILAFRGRKYTLYLSQLKPEEGRSAARMTLKEAFSASINPIFGKIGIYELGRELMAEYAARFLFNRPIPFDLPLAISPIEVPEDDFGLAEVASGFNKTTMISPLHAALLAAAVANGGTIMEPYLIKTIRDEGGHILYQREPGKLASPIKERTARKMRILMDETVMRGTARKAFRSIHAKKIFQSVELGAKTGTINDALDRYRVDWITAYAVAEGESEGICLAGLAVHGEKSGVRAKDMVRAVIDRYFSG